MNYKVTLDEDNNYIVKLSSTQSIKATQSEIEVASNLTDLIDVNIDTPINPNKNNYLLAYNSQSQKFTIVDPDVVLSAALTTSGPQPGLPSDFIDTLDVDLDNKIDLDAGSF
jgi:hypothetical protein